jgi:hypothetical protein
MSYLRRYNGRALLVVLNMSEAPQNAKFDLSGEGFATKQAKAVVSTAGKSGSVPLGSLELKPFEVFIGEVSSEKK